MTLFSAERERVTHHVAQDLRDAAADVWPYAMLTAESLRLSPTKPLQVSILLSVPLSIRSAS